MPPTPFPGIDFDAIAATPFRHTHVRFNTREWRILRKEDGGQIKGADLSPPFGLALPTNASLMPNAPGANRNVTLLPSGSWYITSWEMALQFERQEASGNLVLPIGTVGPVAYAAGVWRFASQNRIPGVTYATDTVTLGSYWARRQRPASGNWHEELTADVAAFVKPKLPTANVPMRRIMNYTGTLPPNSPVYLRFYGPGGPLTTQDAILTFYFGGDVVTAWPGGAATPTGGWFAVTLFGDGRAWLMERTNTTAGGFTTFDDANPWRRVDEFQWEEPGRVAGLQHVLILIPEGRDTLSIIGTGRERLFVCTPKTCGYTSKASMTGTTQMRLDMREDLRLPFQFGSLSFPINGASGEGAGTLYSVPFQTKFRTAAGAMIQMFPAALAENGTSVTVNVYDGNTFAELTDEGGETFSTVGAGQRYFYAVFQLLTNTDHVWSPFLSGFRWAMDGRTDLPEPTPFEGGQVLDVQINGPDTDIDCDSAAVLIEDSLGELAVGAPGEGGLEQHAGFHCVIETAYSGIDPSLRTTLFEGVLTQASGLRTGKNWGPGVTYPYFRWKTWRCHMAGMWYRLNETQQIAWQARDFTRDTTPGLGIDPATGELYPWKIKDIISYCLGLAGFPLSQMMIEGPDTRLFMSGKNSEDAWIQPGVRLGDFIHHLAKDYLGGRLIWDEAAHRWLMVYPPVFSGSYSYLWTFVTNTPNPGTTYAAHMPAAYAGQTIYVENYTTFCTEPEANHFTVATMFVPGKNYNQIDEEAMKGAQVQMVVGVNWRSFDCTEGGYPAPDPSHPDYIPRGVKTLVMVDPCLAGPTVEITQRNLRYVCRRLMNAGAYGLTWIQWRAPLVLVDDPDEVYDGNPRKLRTYDVVRFTEDTVDYIVLLTSCNPHISVEEGGDLHQLADYEGYLIPEPLSY